MVLRDLYCCKGSTPQPRLDHTRAETNIPVNFYQESDDRQKEVIVIQKNIPWSTNMASSVWPESMEMWRLPHRTLPSPTTMKRRKVEHFPFNIHTTKHLDSVTEKGTLQPSSSFLTSQHETPLSSPENGSPWSTFAASTPTKNATESGRHNLSIESNHQSIQILSPDHNSNCSIYAISFLRIPGFRNTRHRLSCVFLFLPLLMRLLLLWEQMLLMFKVCFWY